MSRMVVLLVLFGSAAWADSPLEGHNDRELLPKGCASCHVGHGESGSRLLPNKEEQFCYRCHGLRNRALKAQGEGVLKQGVFPVEVETSFQRPFRHPIERAGLHDPVEGGNQNRHAECLDCHNHHKSSNYRLVDSGGFKRSTLSIFRYEYEMCYRCHGDRSNDGNNIERLLDSANRSRHPVEIPNSSQVPGLTETARDVHSISCSDCHGDNRTDGPSGPHGSDYRGLLKKRNEQSRGVESPDRYALCYGCHEREALLGSSRFPAHNRHVTSGRTSCSDCHDPHGSVNNRALIDFDRNGVGRPTRSGQLRFESFVEGSGTCYTTCHGVEHDPITY